MTTAHLRDPLAEESTYEHGQLGFGLDEIRNRRLHARAAGPRNRERQRIRSAKHRAQIASDFLHHFEEKRVEIPDHRLRHGVVNARLNLRGSGAE